MENVPWDLLSMCVHIYIPGTERIQLLYIYMQGILHIPWCQDCTVHPCISNTHAVGRKPVYTVTLWGLTSLFFNYFFYFNFGFRLDYSRGRIMAREVAVMISIGNECKSKCCVLMVSELQLVHSTNPQV